MAIAPVGSATNHVDANAGGSTTVALPAGAGSGHWALTTLTLSTNATITVPTGWALILRNVSSANNCYLATYQKFLGSSEPASYSWSVTGATTWSVAIDVFSGVDPITPLDVAAVGGTASISTTPTFPAITTVTDNAWVLGVVGTVLTGAASFTLSPPAGTPTATELHQVGATVSGAASWRQEVWYAILAAHGTQAARSGSSTQNVEYITQSLALRPALSSARIGMVGT